MSTNILNVFGKRGGGDSKTYTLFVLGCFCNVFFILVTPKLASS